MARQIDLILRDMEDQREMKLNMETENTPNCRSDYIDQYRNYMFEYSDNLY